MRYTLALLLALGCSPSAGPAVGADAAADAPVVVDVAGDLGAADVGPPTCSYPTILCGGVCVRATDGNCGTCGRSCENGSRCCENGRDSFCSFSLDCQR